jgi:hypothetical protein
MLWGSAIKPLGPYFHRLGQEGPEMPPPFVAQAPVHTVEGLGRVPEAISGYPTAAADVQVQASDTEHGGLAGAEKIPRDEIHMQLLDVGFVNMLVSDERPLVREMHA